MPATISSCCLFPTPRERGERQKPTPTKQTNARKAQRLALFFPGGVIAMLKGLKKKKKKKKKKNNNNKKNKKKKNKQEHNIRQVFIYNTSLN